MSKKKTVKKTIDVVRKVGGASIKANTLKLTANQKARKDAMDSVVTNAHILRSKLLSSLLNPGKDINLECGYPDTIEISAYKAMYKRNGAAKRVVRILPEETWAMPPEIFETEDANKTKFEEAWDALQEERRLFHYLQRIDVLSGIGEFGILLLGVGDGKELGLPVEGINPVTGEKTGTSTHKLIYLKPFDQSTVKVVLRETEPASPRFGFPVTYTIDFEGVESVNSKSSKTVHWTRVLHVADGRETSEVNGTPRMEPIYNRLLDIRKILGGSGEMFWKGGFPGLSFETQPDVEELDIESVKDQVESYMSGLQRYFAMEGIIVKSLAPQVESPKEHIETNMRNIAISLGIPYRIFLGTEEAKLASSQDMRTWNKRLSQRQENYVSPYLIRPFVDRLIAFGMLPEVEEYTVKWPDLNAPTDEDKANVAKSLTEALSKYVAGGVDALIPPMEYLTMVLGFSQEEAKAIEKASMQFIGLEEEEEEDVEEEDIQSKKKKVAKKKTVKKKIVKKKTTTKKAL